MLLDWIVRWLRLGVPCIAVVAIVTGQAQAQDRTTGDRLDRIERDLSMLQRQVYRGAPAVMAPGGSTNAADVEIRMERLETQMRELTGRVEQIGNGLEQIRQRIEQINSDLDVRFGQMAGTAAGPPSRARGGDEGRFAGGPPPAATGMPPGTVVPPPSGGLTPIFNTLTPPGTNSRPPPPPAPPSRPGPEPANVEPPPTKGTVNEQFNRAFGLVKQGEYSAAETALRAFIEAHPNDALTGNAHYWLGQTYYARNKFPEAASAFAEGYKRFPKGSKAPEDLLYLSLSLAKADQKKNACLALAQLDQAFPNSAATIRERAGAEKKRLGCG